MKKSSANPLRHIIALIAIVFGLIPAGSWLVSCRQGGRTEHAGVTEVKNGHTTERDGSMTDRIYKTDEEWRSLLTPEQYGITRQKGTEPPFSGEYYNFHGKGVYLCVCCGAELFRSETKFESGSGWPSFYEPVSRNNITEDSDDSYGMRRIEIECSRCGAHLGHVFNDGPEPTGLRYCVNSASLRFVSDSTAK